MANARGGARKGAGRPSLAEKYGGHIAEVHDRIAERLPRLIENLFTLADGVTVQEPDEQGGVRVYTRPPDRQANVDLMNRIMGKPTERQEIVGDEDAPLTIRVIYADALALEHHDRTDDAEAPRGPEGDPGE